LADNGLIHEEALALFSELFRGEHRFALPSVITEP
jgi:hypothetical protein